MERAFQCSVTVGHLAHFVDLTERQIYGLKKKWEDGQDLAQTPKPGRPRSEARVQAQHTFRDKVRQQRRGDSRGPG